MNKIIVDGILYHREELCSKHLAPFAATSAFHHELNLFLKEWFSSSPSLTLHTSGSTGVPKKIVVRKEQVTQSAAITCNFFRLKKDDRALLCLPLEYIAGKMMVVRAIYAGLNLILVEPSGNPMTKITQKINFAAMVPLQVYNSLQTDEEKKRILQIKKLIIGGGAIDKELEETLRDFPNEVYSTYGMTETISHIALRRINGSSASDYYFPLPGVSLRLSEERTLIIDAPHVADSTLYTNDIAEIRADGSFRILGRKDNVINSSGVKIQIEEVERILQSYIHGHFAVTSVPHPKLGEAVVLLIEPESDIENIHKIIKSWLPRFQQPRHIFHVGAIPKTASGKIDRVAAKNMAAKMIPIQF